MAFIHAGEKGHSTLEFLKLEGALHPRAKPPRGRSAARQQLSRRAGAERGQAARPRPRASSRGLAGDTDTSRTARAQPEQAGGVCHPDNSARIRQPPACSSEPGGKRSRRIAQNQTSVQGTHEILKKLHVLVALDSVTKDLCTRTRLTVGL